ncbi:hypothetical protein GCM10027174_36910 [Salinifilum aidingensis]
MRSAGRAVAAVGAVALGLAAWGLAACSPGEPEGPQEQQPSTSSAPPTSTAPSAPRHVPPQQRVRLSDLTAEDICGLVSPGKLAGLAFPVDRGTPRTAGTGPRVPGCEFPAPDGPRSVLLGAQPPGFADLGREEVELDELSAETSTSAAPTSSAQEEPPQATRTLRANSCTVYTPVADATLQVTLVQPESGTDQCELAEDVTTYLRPALVE